MPSISGANSNNANANYNNGTAINNNKHSEPLSNENGSSTTNFYSSNPNSTESTPDNERMPLLTVPASPVPEFHFSPSTEELGCYFTISSAGSTTTYDEVGSESPTTATGITKTETGSRNNNKNQNKDQQKAKQQNKVGRKTKMSQDAEVGPEVLFIEPEKFRGDVHAHLYNATRSPMNQDEFDKQFHYRHPRHAEGELVRRGRNFLRHYYRPCFSGQELTRFIFRLIPIFDWLPHYPWRNNLLNDAVGGLIVGVMHVPQGIAYAKLAGVDAVVGLYTSFFPPLFYMLFGTSRHNSIGSFAVVSLMSGAAVTRFMTQNGAAGLLDPNDGANSTGTETQQLLSPVVVSSTLACCVGLIQIAMGILRLELITTYFSDQVVAGFSTGASIHVFTAQLKDIFGLRHLPRHTGAGYLFRQIYDIVLNIQQTNVLTFSIAIASMVFLCIGKEVINPWIKRRFHLMVPIPFELILMIMATAISQFFYFHSTYDVNIVNHIPTGLPEPFLPQFSLIPSLLPDALGIAAVVIAIHISLAKMFAKKMAYRVDAGQELFALGFSASLSSFFPIYPISCSLGRTLVNVEAGTKTQLSTLFSSALLAAIILYMGQWLRALPMCILAAIIIVALKGIFRKITDLRTLWPLSKIDFSIWLISFLATVCWDVTQGLAVSIIFALMTTVFRTQWPRWHFLANLAGTNDFRDAERYEMVCAYPGICIFRFDSPLLFTNVDNFKKTIHKSFRRWNRYQQQQKDGGVGADSRSKCSFANGKTANGVGKQQQQYALDMADDDTSTTTYNNNSSGLTLAMRTACTASPPPPTITIDGNGVDDEDNDDNDRLEDRTTKSNAAKYKTTPKMMTMPIYYRHFIVDCSGFTFVDCMGVNALKEIFTEMRKERVLVYFAAAKAPVRDLFEKCGFYSYVQKHNFYPTIRDAVAIARKRRNASTQYLLDEPTERNYDMVDAMQSAQPME